jgi:hypothetical protein
MKSIASIAIILTLSSLIFLSCEEYYRPALDEVTKVLVVESHITNDPLQNFVQLSKTRNFYSTDAIDWVGGATVELVESNFQIIKAREDSPGYYPFPSVPVPGKKYRLRITIQKDVYESDYLVMPAVPTLDSLYTEDHVDKIYKTNGYNVPELFDRPGRQIFIDAPSAPGNQYYRFSCRSVIQWIFNPFYKNDSVGTFSYNKSAKAENLETAFVPPIPLGNDTSKHFLYGWISVNDNDLFNLTGPKEFSSTKKIQKHLITSLAYNSYEYLDSTVQMARNWIIILDQYAIPKESYDFHEKMNRQFEATGNLFDPLMTQIHGNIRCKSDAEKIALGLFDLNSYQQHRYYLNLCSGKDNTVVLRKLNEFFDIPDRGYKKDEPPVFWETNYKR